MKLPLQAIVCLAFLLAIGSALPDSYPTVPMRGVKGNVPMPLIGIGTWQYNDSVAAAEVEAAFDIGYRHVDTALGYKNQEGVGAGLAKAVAARGLKRQGYFESRPIFFGRRIHNIPSGHIKNPWRPEFERDQGSARRVPVPTQA